MKINSKVNSKNKVRVDGGCLQGEEFGGWVNCCHLYNFVGWFDCLNYVNILLSEK